MKLHDFGLWFGYWDSTSYAWYSAVPHRNASWIDITYDGVAVAVERNVGLKYELIIFQNHHAPYTIMIKCDFSFGDQRLPHTTLIIDIGRRLTLDDFEIVKNPDYRGDQ